MPRRQRSLRKFRLMALAVVGGVQLPGLGAIAHLTRFWPLAAGGAALLSSSYLWTLRSPFDDRPKSRLHLYMGLWPFFAWWASCLWFLLLLPGLFVLSWALGAPLDRVIPPSGGLAILLGAWSTLRRPWLRRVNVRVSGLPAELHGFRIGHLTDVHCGAFTTKRRVDSWVQRLNREQPDLIAVTGDLITTGDAFVKDVIGALAGLRAKSAVFVSMGNHDYFTDGDRFAADLERAGLPVLRNRGVVLPHRGRALYVAGVDDTWTGRADVERALAERPPEMVCVLLAHDPNLFPEAARRGVALTLSGHTHGGQIAIPFVSRRWTLARVITRFTAGLYYIGDAALYVSRGAGTTGPPVRIGASGEITILTLCEGSRVRPAPTSI